MAADVGAAAQLLRRECGVRSLVYLGVCSGGNVAIGALPRLPAPAGLVLLSIYPFSDGDSFGRDVHRTWHYAREYARKACRAETWARLVRGDIRLRQVGNVLFGHVLRRKKRNNATEPAVPAATAEPGPPRTHLAKLRPDLPALLIYGTADPDTRAARQYYEAYATAHRLPIQFIEIPGANHNFSSLAWTRQITELTLDFCRRLARQPG
jgi:pimeloyl-ACP methyl ester carboxylesterase